MIRKQNVNLYEGSLSSIAPGLVKYFTINTICYPENIEEFIILFLFYVKIPCQIRKNNI